jgi:hypothetical protein
MSPHAFFLRAGSVVREEQLLKRRLAAQQLVYTCSGGTTLTTASGRPMTFAQGQAWIVLAYR